MVNIAIYGKGGIGKSTMSANITAALSDRGLKVLQIGCDPKHDSTRLLLDGRLPQTILDYMKETPENERRLEDVISVGYKGCLCAESGGPEPGVGCAGRGIISAFNLLFALGIDSVPKDVTLYDVLGDVVCGGFAVPIRNEYADRIIIVSSGEFMSIYAANNILRGVANYNPDRIGGIIFNSRGGPEEEGRIERFSNAVKIPIIARFDRSKLFADAEERRKTVVELHPDSKEAETFRELCSVITEGRLYHANHLSDEDLERVVLERATDVRTNDPKKDKIPLITGNCERRKYTSSSVEKHEPLGGCAFAGAQCVCASIEGLATVLHSPLNCAQFTFQLVSGTSRRADLFGTDALPNYLDPQVSCTEMTEDDMIFGGVGKLRTLLERLVSDGQKRMAVVTSCASGIIGDNVKDTVTEIERRYPDVRIALIEEDGDINGDFMQGVIDAGISLSRRFSEKHAKTDSVNLLGIKTMATNCMETVRTVTEALNALGIKVNCTYPGCGNVDELAYLQCARYNLLLNPDRFTYQLAHQLEDDFGIPFVKNAVRPGLTGMRSWLGEVATLFGKMDEFQEHMSKIESEYSERAKGIPNTLKGKHARILSLSKDIDWLIEGAESSGIVIDDAAVIDSTQFCNESEIISRHPAVRLIGPGDLKSETERLTSADTDMIFTSARLPSKAVQVPIPMVWDNDPYFAIRYFTNAARRLMTPQEAGWRKDAVRP